MLTPGRERGGLILPRNKLVEFDNLETGDEAYKADVRPEHAPLLMKAIGTWHTHPSGSSNLSAGDAQTFRQWPDLLHAVVGEDGVSWYRVEGGNVLNA